MCVCVCLGGGDGGEGEVSLKMVHVPVLHSAFVLEWDAEGRVPQVG